MTAYYAQWNNAPNGACKLDMYVRPCQFINWRPPQFEQSQPDNDSSTQLVMAEADFTSLVSSTIDTAVLHDNMPTWRRAAEQTEPTFEQPFEASIVASTLDSPIEPSLKSAPYPSSEFDFEPSLKSSSEWPMDPSFEPFLNSLSHAASEWPSEPSLEPAWAAPAQAPAESPVQFEPDSPYVQAIDRAVPALAQIPSEEATQPDAELVHPTSVETHAEPLESLKLVDAAALDSAAAEQPPAGTPITDSSDFSDLIALAGSTFLDDRYHDHPSGKHPALPALNSGHVGGAPLLLDGDETDPLAALSTEYQQALLHHKRGYSHELKNVSDDNAPIVAPPNDPFLFASERDAEGSLLEDLLGSNRNIDTVLESLDAFGAGQIFESDEQHEILALLAPGGTQNPLFPQPALLTRQEHHLITVDSHLSMLDSTQPHQEQNSHHENQH
jgi:hypothetical protein